MQSLEFLLAPMAFVVLLIGIHSYLGLHVLARDVIFVDISLSQVAALGAGFGHLYFGEDAPEIALAFSLSLCLAVALILALFRKTEKKISQEAIIGVTYAMSSGLLLLVLNQLPHGAEHLKTSLIGNILFVTWKEVLQTMLVYGLVGTILFKIHNYIWHQSNQGNGSFLWDFLFYFLFGVVITFSTQHAGVLVVFTVLVVPAAISSRFLSRFKNKLLLSWLIGVLGVLLAFLLSLKFDWPPGAGIVTTLSSLFFIIMILGNLYEKSRRSF